MRLNRHLLSLLVSWITCCGVGDCQVTIMPFGDSITRGYQGGGVERGSYRRELEDFLNFVAVDFDFVGDMSFGADGLIDKEFQAIVGHTTRRMTEDFRAAIEDHQPDVVLVLAGTNDHNNPTGFQADYDELVSMIGDSSPRSAVIASTIPDFGCCRATPTWTQEYVDERNDVNIPAINASIVAVATEQSAAVVDLNAVISSSDLVENDWVHLNRRGQNKLAYLFLRELLHVDAGILTAAVMDTVLRGRDPKLDFDGSGFVDASDHSIFLSEFAHTVYGDANLDGVFNSADFVTVFLEGTYEDSISHNSTWASGDWNGDGEFASSDIVLAYRSGGYESGRRAATLPEPAGLCAMGAVILFSVFRRQI